MFELDIDGPVATIWIDRGEKANAVPLSEWSALEQAVSVANVSTADLIVLRSRLPGVFCAGADLTELEQLSIDVGMRRRFRGAMISVFQAHPCREQADRRHCGRLLLRHGRFDCDGM